MLPQDPVILLSVVNARLRDLYPDLDELCHSEDADRAQLEEKLASECGYWPLWRYVPELKAEGKNPFILTSKEPNGQLLDFMMGETRFASLTRTFPETAKVLFAEAEELCAQRYAKYKHLAEQ